jgi:Protein of unknown function (DUF2865)
MTRLSHWLAPVALLALVPGSALAQAPQPPPGGGAATAPVCTRLEAQLAAIDRGVGGDPARADQAKRLEDTLNKQQADLDRTQSQWQRLGCQPVNLFSIFMNQSSQCGPLNGQIQQMRAAIDRTTSDLQRLRHGGDDEMQRQGVIQALAQNNCGAQYRAAAAPPQPRGFFETLFGINPAGNAPPPVPGDYPQVAGGAYKTLCVRTCDGYYFPISFSTSASHFADDEQACQKLCPATEAVLFSHHNPGEDMTQAVANNGKLYRDLANAFRYRREFVPACSCKAPGQSWADALGGKDTTVERGDIVVNEERAKQMSLPRDPQGRPPAPAPPAAAPPQARRGAATMPIAPPDASAEADPAKRVVRPVGPTFLPR